MSGEEFGGSTFGLTSITTQGWFIDESNEELDLLTSVSTLGWYGVTLKDLIVKYPTVDFGLIVDRFHEMGVEIEEIHEIEHLDITTIQEIGNFEITQLFDIKLIR
ncbi:hypothetical protein OAK92_00865 [Crocinitomicaceae bacterium]|nr:hypothetical protein [Crocinitomicaceae bacterium]